MGGQAINAPRGTFFRCDPKDLKIITDPKHPRYDSRVELPVDQGLVDNITALGVLKPVLVCVDGETVEVLDGRQRVRAAREVNKLRKAQRAEPILVPVIVRSASDDNQAVFLRESANIHLPDSVLTKAKKAKHMVDVLGQSVEQVRIAFGVEPQTMKNWLALVTCIPAVQNSVEAGKLTASAATKLAKLSREDQATKLREMMDDAGQGRKGRADKGSERGHHAGMRKSVLRKLIAILDAGESPLGTRETLLLRWISGDATDGELTIEIPGMIAVLARIS